MLISCSDSTKYRTPYAPWGGFTNGYEGNFRAHLMKSPDTILGYPKQSPDVNGKTPLPSIKRNPSSASNGMRNSMDHSPYAPRFETPTQSTQPAATTPVIQSPIIPMPSGSNILQTASGPYDPDSVLTKLHPAIRAQYAAMLQRKQGQSPQQTPDRRQSQSQGHEGNSASSASPKTCLPHSPQTTDLNYDSAPARPVDQNQSRTQHVRLVEPPHQDPQHSYPAVRHLPQAHLGNGSHMVQPELQTSSDCAQHQVVGTHPTPSAGPRPQTPTEETQQQSPTLFQRSEATTPTHSRQAAPKQTPVPPPRPWEQLQRTTPIKTMPPPPVQPLATTMDAGSGPSQLAYNQGAQPTNVSGPFWQTPPQTMPNSNSLSPQPPFDPFQFINFQ